MIFAFLSKNVAIRIYALLLAKFARMSGIGGGGGEGGGSQPNFGNARILGAFGPPTHPLRHQDKLNHDDAADQNEWQLTHIQLSTP